jgi:acetyl-CoA/propionyl-CoA carboxylase biotin carboxyl carrier protein
MISRILIANRGEIAVRIARTCRAEGRGVVVVHSDPDAQGLHVALADHAVGLPGESATETYLNGAAIVEAAKATGADAVHPGYGFLAENADFAEAVTQAGLIWIGPSAAAIRAMGDKVSAREVATKAGVPCVPGTPRPVEGASAVESFGAEHGYPVVIKAAGGGGGRGMRVVRGSDEAADCFDAATREALAGFGDPRVYVERYLEWPRHVEVQVLADQDGTCIALGERDCSVQRRHQKLVEEAPAPALAEHVRDALHAAAVSVAEAVGYVGAGTVEFLVDGEHFYFLEMNTRLQVEHPVTEEVFGVDLVAEQLSIADGGRIDPWLKTASPRGHAIEVRINAEDPAGGRFLPSPGRIAHLQAPGGAGIRFDGGYQASDEVPSHYDNLIGKLIAWGRDRETARRRLLQALSEFRLDGVATTVPALVTILEHEEFAAMKHATPWLETRVTIAETPAGGHESEAVSGGEGSRGSSDEEVWVAGRRYVLGPPMSPPTGNDDPPTVRSRRQPQRHGPGASGRSPSHKGVANGVVVAPMQGTVIRIAVKEQVAVTPGDVLCVLEAMKMENEVTADVAGVVAEVAVTEGEGVAAGQLLFRVVD